MQSNYDLLTVGKQFYSGLVCDVLDYFGYRSQSLSPAFQPLEPDMVLWGRAYTTRAVPAGKLTKESMVNQCKSIEGVKDGEIYIMACQGAYLAGVWGEIMSTGVRVNGGVGALIDGMIRDSNQVKEMRFPVISRGHLPTTAKGRMEIVDIQCDVVIDGVVIHPGDLIFGDIDGVAVIPQQIENDVIQRCLAIIASENVVRDRVLAGDPISKVYMEIDTI